MALLTFATIARWDGQSVCWLNEYIGKPQSNTKNAKQFKIVKEQNEINATEEINMLSGERIIKCKTTKTKRLQSIVYYVIQKAVICCVYRAAIYYRRNRIQDLICCHPEAFLDMAHTRLLAKKCEPNCFLQLIAEIYISYHRILGLIWN